MLFDWLIIGEVLAVNPAHAVRGPKHVVRRGKTPVLTEEQARRLLDSIDTSSQLAGLQDYLAQFAEIPAPVVERNQSSPSGLRGSLHRLQQINAGRRTMVSGKSVGLPSSMRPPRKIRWVSAASWRNKSIT
jgi:hypothetical protein